ncbi:FAD binding domain-containing protein [Actinokineospora bangkokensis]|uniref:Molybdopterin dehydrogenase n=1 Tax=Actinokineospora bangkokensis TaxID=1193682 RepID=A0A1Q9LSK4_9PSEU|nr:xanthine dehydrogenase family protein subunit M [Actinokineospora bangkokensis]OLR95037.1 molybdopterin dehydrogenase [Actinokineospora bangkokensis]
MKPFAYQRAADARSAVAAVAADPGAAFLAGGTNLVDHLKLGVATPSLLVDVSGLAADVVEALPGGGLRIGAGTRNADLAAHPVVRAYYPLLSQALLSGASGQLRNMATTGGNLLQRTRCDYFRDVTAPCNKRLPGSGCPAVAGNHRHHAILGASRECVATHPSDMAAALVALDALVVVLGPEGERRVPVEQLYRLPGREPERDTVLAHGELVTAVELPPPFGGYARYRKVRDRASFAFALVSVAAVVRAHDGVVDDLRVVFGGVAHRPWRARAAEEVLRGSQPTEGAFRAAAEAELLDAHTLPGNAFKVPLVRATLVSVLRELAGRPAGQPEEER